MLCLRSRFAGHRRQPRIRIGPSQILFDVSLRVDAGEMVTLLGRNGMGKTTTVRSIMGLTRPRAGTIRFRDTEIQGWPSYAVARAGIGLVPEGRQVFPNLTVRENLLVAAGYGSDPNEAGGEPWTLERIYEMFPPLEARKNLNGRNLSGGEQQMLAIGRALMTNARLILLDEATEGLAPRSCVPRSGAAWNGSRPSGKPFSSSTATTAP